MQGQAGPGGDPERTGRHLDQAFTIRRGGQLAKPCAVSKMHVRRDLDSEPALSDAADPGDRDHSMSADEIAYGREIAWRPMKLVPEGS
jgi:hypothetical protein